MFHALVSARVQIIGSKFKVRRGLVRNFTEVLPIIQELSSSLRTAFASTLFERLKGAPGTSKNVFSSLRVTTHRRLADGRVDFV